MFCEHQTIENKKGEILFRKKLVRQHAWGEKVFDDEFSPEQVKEMLLEKMDKTHKQLEKLQEEGIKISPFLEIAAERAQRSLVLVNDFNAHGFAVDISYDSLKSCDYFANIFKKNKMPIRICCDIYNLPFKSNSIPFIFCYEALHHFPNQIPVVAEIHRVLSNGYFFFDGEPFKRVLKIKLYKQKGKIYSDEKIQQKKIFRIIESFISEWNCNEMDYGVVENQNISLNTWKRALKIFDKKEVELSSKYFKSNLFNSNFNLNKLLNHLLGGIISGLCQKKSKTFYSTNDIYDILGCPNCTIKNEAGEVDKPQLKKEMDFLLCPICNSKFPIKDNILFLFREKELRELYPEIL